MDEQKNTSNTPEAPAPHENKTMGRKGKIAIILLAVAVVFLVGYIIVDKLRSSEGKETATTSSETSTEKHVKSTTKAKEDKTENETEEKTSEEKTEAKSEDKTEEATEKKTEGDKEDAKTVIRPAVYATVNGGNSWQSANGFVVQYSVDIHNMKADTIKDWEVRIPGFEDGTLGDGWCAEFALEDGVLSAKPVDFNTSIEGKGTTNLGFQVEFKDEAASKKVKTDAAEVYLSGKLCEETIEIPTAADIEKKRVVEPENGTPLEEHGALSVKGVDLVDESGKLYQLKGVSTHGIAWFPDYVNEESFRTFRDKWGANLIRLAMYTGESGGYCSDGNKEDLKALVEKGVEYASKLGMYVIIDWHILSDNNPKTNQDDAILFFDEMSKKYADYKNVLYEICNEPNGGTKWQDIKEYAEKVIPVIRKNAPDAVIIVGTPTWSQDVDKAAEDPIEGEKNIMYTLHFYAATHKDNLRDKLTEARDKGLPIFISEFSICDASGNGAIDYESANAWYQLIEDYGLSYAAWNISNKAESSALIRSDCEKTSDWSDDELSETGLWIKNSMK